MYNPDPLSLFEDPDDEQQKEKINRLKEKMAKILANEAEIMNLLSLIPKSTESFDSIEDQMKFFPISAADELAKLDADLAYSNNKYEAAV